MSRQSTMHNARLYIILCIHWDTQDKKIHSTSGFTDSRHAKKEAVSTKSMGKNQNGHLFNPSRILSFRTNIPIFCTSGYAETVHFSQLQASVSISFYDFIFLLSLALLTSSISSLRYWISLVSNSAFSASSWFLSSRTAHSDWMASCSERFFCR